jgi:cytochrome o ubiquinol oxidase subunit IV
MHEEKALTMRTIGFVISLALTTAAFSILFRPEFFHLDIDTAILVILVLAVVQALAQFIFFLNLWREKGPRWNLGVFASTVSIIFIVIFFSIWIMDHLNYNMMP